MKFFIIDKNNETIDSSDNILQLRMTCSDMNSRIGENYQVVSEKKLEDILKDNQKSYVIKWDN